MMKGFYRVFGPVIVIVICTFLRPCAAQVTSQHALATNVSPALAPQQGEIKLAGTVGSLDTATGSLVVLVSSVMYPGKDFVEMDPPRPKSVSIRSATTLIRATPGPGLKLYEIKPGVKVTVVGKDFGIGRELPARLLEAAVTPELQDSRSPGSPLSSGQAMGDFTIALKTFASLNAVRLHAGLPPLALHPGLMAMTREIAADKLMRATPDSIPGPDLQLARRLSDQLYGAAPYDLGGFASTAHLLPDSAARNLLGGPGGFSDRRFILDPEYRTAGLSATRGFGLQNQLWNYWTTAYGREEPGEGCLIPLLFESTASPSSTMFFPVLGGAHWSDTFGQPRAGHTHQGQDLMAPKMRPLIACFDGTVWLSLDETGTSSQGNAIHLSGDNGWNATYMHVNCDTPGTRDGMGGARYAFAPGLTSGDHVRAGQFLGYTGDSGNARGRGTHCHFELSPTGGSALNAAPYLRAARVLNTSLPALRPAERSAQESSLAVAGEIQLNGVVSSVEDGRVLLKAASCSWFSGKTVMFSAPRMKKILLPRGSNLPVWLRKEASLSVVGKDDGVGSPLVARLIIIRL